MSFFNRKTEARTYTQQEVDALLAEGKTELEGLKTQNTDLSGKITNQESELSMIKTQLEKLNTRGSSNGNEHTESPSSNKGLASVFDNEEEAFNTRLNPVVNQTMANTIQLARMNAESAFKNDSHKTYFFNKYQGDYQKLVETLSPQQAMNPQAYENCLKLIMGDHMGEVATKGNAFFTEGVSASAPAPAPKETQPTNEETEMARKLGISIDTYMKSKKEMVLV